jgi:RNA polymerase-binding transcription factor DksA
VSTEWEMEMAQKLEESERESGVQRIRDKARQRESHPDFDGEHCIDCEDDIPAERLAMGKIRCVPCQLVLERVRR